MNADVEDLLREGMERFTGDLRAPAGLTSRAARRRRRRLALRSATGVAVLAAGAVALVAVVVPGAADNGAGGPVVTAAYVVKHVDSALNAAEPSAIAQMTVTTQGAVIAGGAAKTTTTKEWSYGDRWRSVTYSQAGHPVYDEGSSVSAAYTVVSYLTRTWARQARLRRLAAPEIGPHGCGPVAAGPPGPSASPTAPKRPAIGAPAGPAGGPPGPRQPAVPLLFQFGLPGVGFAATSLFASSPPATVARDLRTAISCGALTVAGRQRVDGIEAIELTSRRISLISETIWVTPGTYLPVRVVVRSAPGAPGLRQTADITWLRPTAVNLARLTVPIPAGFRQVPLIRVVLPILQQFARGPLPKAGSLRLLVTPGRNST
jgi:hypothetical protein